jgi:hypothetical protein
VPLHLARPVSAAALLLFAWIWPADEAPVPAGRKAALLAVCRDAVEERLDVELDATVLDLPTVSPQGGGQFLLSATVMIEGEPQSFSCEVHASGDALRVAGIRLLHW